jgi:hypothetical protein
MGLHGGEQNDVHHLYFMCDDLDAEIAGLADAGLIPGSHRSAADVVIVARLAVLVDVIAVASRIAIILVTADYGASDAAEHTTHGRTRASAYAGKNGTRDSTDAGTDYRSSSRPGNLVIVGRIRCAAA